MLNILLFQAVMVRSLDLVDCNKGVRDLDWISFERKKKSIYSISLIF